jgi:hypothetical protein
MADDGDAASQGTKDGAADIYPSDGSLGVDAADISDESDVTDDAPNDGADRREFTGPPRCVGEHAACARYASDNPLFCQDHGCTWSGGGCSGTPHGCPTLTQNICNSHEGCTLQ